MFIINSKFNPFSLLAIPAVFVVVELFSRYQLISGIILASLCILVLVLIFTIEIIEYYKKSNKVKKGASDKHE